MAEPPKKGQINIELTDDVAQGIYSNFAIITHTQMEFVIDFLSMMPGIPKAKVRSRVILTPHHAKRFYKALKENIAKFENMHGEIKVPETEAYPFPLGGGPFGEA